MTWTFSVPMAIPSGNAIKRALYNRDKGYYKRLRTDLGWLIKMHARDVPEAKGPRRVNITRMIPKGGKFYDHDNLVMGCKPLVDELVAHGLLIGDGPGQVTVDYHQERGQDVETIVEVRDE